MVLYWLFYQSVLLIVFFLAVHEIQASQLVKCDALRNLAPIVQFKKGEKHPWKNASFSKVAGF